ncbi:MAG: hypothetical protein A3H96_13665 [Acidobacteria bacterium RIFCSPLOWO2_02_FULL_67_36]|nr:MAG: hypothetical protein A3H96_13665 [Acidobacteria bacterium RIFCSPLOWO2_02_FULL_67_36]OFW25528.1 MAG: hypothetical protein A3G21_12130 [Acidobacteria bacterium RIFCSPLOWO2_12_FULL_66_21]
MRLFVAVSLLTIVAAGTAAAQTARCVLSLRPYGLGGECQVEAGPPGTRMRLPFENGVKIWITSGPRDQPPWRGNLSLPKVETSFEIAEERGVERRLVFRTGLAWLLIREWRELDTAPKDCSACDRSAKDVSLVLDLAASPPATEDDIAILGTALAKFRTPAHWNRKEDQSCPPGEAEVTGLFCALYTAVEGRMGRYHHRQPALEIVRSVVFERWRQRIVSHPLVDMNNHPDTTIDDLRMLLDLSLARARADAPPKK